MVTCPMCKGKGYGEGFMCGPGGHRYGKIPCSDCKESGEITEDHAERIRVGKLMRDERVHTRGLSQREEATRLGVSVAEWSRIEHGREPETLDGRTAWQVRLEEIQNLLADSQPAA